MTLPQFVYGTAWKKEHTTELVLQAWEAGFRAFDTACQPKHYREDLVGEALARLAAVGVTRDQYHLQTKYTPESGQDPTSIPYDPSTPIPQQVQQSLRVSLQNLHTDYLDALILHSPIMPFRSSLAAWRTMEEFVAQGKVKHLGISNCYEMEFFEKLYQNTTIKPAILQNRFYRQTDYDKQLRAFCRESGVLYQSFWTLTANPDLLEHPSLFELARRHRKTPAQLLFRYLTLRGVCPLTGTRDVEHMREDLEVFEFDLGEDELARVDVLL
ncbi:diketogulonate reductase-like aldo/keto reductase [Alteromonadaceae bacterium 2753L.S.0a.02]|nr:diketogulonate reductase-like aldo/keto reductase [Alteromonadaceae bacterium 2753L.S.0a.02]